jgi:hypothetical protein
MSTKPAFSDVQEPRYLPPLKTSVDESLNGSVASVQIAAGAAGVRHVADNFSFSVARDGAAALAFSTVRVSIIDGATGTTSYLWSDVLTISSIGVLAVPYSNMALAGTAATAMTVEFDKAVSGAWNTLNLGYFDVGP